MQVTVALDSNGGKALSPMTLTVSYDSAYGDLPKAEREGYVFQGWYLQKDGAEQILPASTVRIVKAHILYAHWQEEETPIHVHSYSETVTKKGTCTEDGLKTFTCSECGEYYTEVIPALGHNYSDWKTIKGATCQEEGEEQRICERCGEVEKRSLKKTAHQYDAEVIASTCKSFGYTINTCRMCGEAYKDNYRNYTDHTVVTDKAVEPTCSSNGLTEGSHCSVCGKVIKKQEVIPKKKEESSGKPEETKPAEPDKPKTPADPNHSAVEEKGRQITSQKNDGDPKGSVYGLLCARVKKSAKTSNTLGWNRVAEANGYIVYGNQCGTRYHFVKLAEVKGTGYTHKKLKKGTYYKYLVVAYKNISGSKTIITISKTMHAATIGGKVGNCKELKLNKTKVTLRRKKTFKLKVKEVTASKKLKIKRHRKIAFESSNPKIATVTKAGKIKGLRKGRCKIYVYAQNGVYKAVTVKVK